MYNPMSILSSWMGACESESVIGPFVHLYDLVYQWIHGLIGPEAEVGSILRLRVRRYRGRPFMVADGTPIRRGDLIGEIHLNNERVAALHDGGCRSRQAGLAARRAFQASLVVLAERARRSPHDRPVRAFYATTIFYQAAERLGFEVHPLPRPRLARLVAAFQRRLLAHFHPLGKRRPGRRRFAEARQIWISMDELLRRYALERSSARDTHL
jgi:hypothetical protein